MAPSRTGALPSFRKQVRAVYPGGTMQSRGSHQLTHGSRPKECEVSRYRHGCDPPDDVNLSRRPPQRSRIADFSFPLSNLHSFLADTIPWSRLTVHDVSSGPVHVTMESVLGD